MKQKHGNIRRLRLLAAGLAFVLLFLGLAPAAEVQAAAPKAFIFLKGSPTKTYTKSKPRYIYVGGKTVNLDYSVNGKIKGIKGTWSSGNKKIATVNKNGVVKAVGNGATTIHYTFTYKGKSYSMKTYVCGRTRAKSCKVYASDPKDFNGKIEIGGYVDINRTLTPIDKAVKITPSIKSTYKAYGALYDDAACTEEHDGSVATLGDKFVITGESDGIVYFKANARNSKTNMDYNVNSNVIKITVGEGKDEEEEKPDVATGAKQTDADKITVTSTTDITKITIKMGNTTLTQKTGSPEIAADKRSAVVTLPGNLQEAAYTVFINDATEGIEVKCTTRTIDKIELDSSYAVLDKLAATTVNGKVVPPKATVKYKVFDQFGNDITKNAAYPYSDFTSGGLFKSISQGVLEYEFPNGYTPVVGTKYDVLLVHTGTTKTLKAEVELAKPAYVDKVTFGGIYRYDASKEKYVLMADSTTCSMSEGDDPIISFGGMPNNTKTDGAYYVLFKAENQYGGNVAMAGVNYSSLVVNMSSGTTRLALQPYSYNGSASQVQSINPILIDNVEYLAYPIQPIDSGIKEGIAYLTAYAVGSSANVRVTLNIGAKKGIKTFTVNPTETAYEAKDTYLDYSIVDTYGNNVTAYDTLVKYCELADAGSYAQFPKNSTIISSTEGATFAWVKQEDGSAKLRYTPTDKKSTNQGSGDNMAYAEIISTMSGSVNYKTLSMRVYLKPYPVKIYGVRSDAMLGAVTSGQAVSLRLRDLQIIDQYGADMTPELVKSSGYQIKIAGAINDAFTGTISGGAIKLDPTEADSLENSTGIYNKLVSLNTTAKSGSLTLTVSLQDKAGNDISNSSATVVMKSVATSDLLRSSYKVKELGTLYNAKNGTDKYLFEVTGTTVDGTKVVIPQDYIFAYGVGTAQQFIDASGSAVAIQPGKVSLEDKNYPINSNNYRSAEFKYTVVVDDGYGTTVSTSVIISDEPKRAASLTINGTEFTVDKTQTVWNQIASNVTILDQYGKKYNVTSGTDSVRILLSYGSGITVTRNGTSAAQITGGSGTVTARIFVNDVSAAGVVLTVN